MKNVKVSGVAAVIYETEISVSEDEFNRLSDKDQKNLIEKSLDMSFESISIDNVEVVDPETGMPPTEKERIT